MNGLKNGWIYIKIRLSGQVQKRHYEHIYKKHISQRLGNLPLNEITQLQIKSLINKLEYGISMGMTQNKTRVILSRFI